MHMLFLHNFTLKIFLSEIWPHDGCNIKILKTYNNNFSQLVKETINSNIYSRRFRTYLSSRRHKPLQF